MEGSSESIPPPKPATKRKPHRKSKIGCKQCRASRVKCDELKPSCSYCTRHSVDCSFLSTEPNFPSTTSRKVTSRTASLARGCSEGNTGGWSPHPNSNSALCNNLPMKDLELLLQYNTSTALTIASQNPANNDVWAVSVPQIALKHPFLMHGVLGIAALHLSRLDADRNQEYVVLAAKHRKTALPLFYAEADEITERNCAAIFACTVLVGIYAIASSNYIGFLTSPDSGGNGLLGGLYLLRGVQAIISTQIDLVKQSPLAPLVDHQNRILNPSDKMALDMLSTFYTIPLNSTQLRIAELKIYHEALSLLRDSFANFNDLFEPLQPVPYIWFTVISERYLLLLSQRRPEALVLLAYECVVLKRSEPCWFVDSIADRMMCEVMENLTPEWRLLIEWPLQEMRVC